MSSSVNTQGIIIDLSTDTFKTFSLGAEEFCEYFKLPEGVIFDIGADQSNTCTGITIRSVEPGWLIMFEVINDGVTFDFYRKILLLIFDRILYGTKIRYLIMEEPLGYITGRRQESLTKLKNLLKDFIENYDHFECKKFDFIAPQSWRKGLMSKDNPHPKTSKLACVWEIQRMYPLTVNMKSHEKSTGTDYDGFESCGILVGYLNRYSISNDTDVIKILGPRNTIKIGIGYFIYGPKAQERLISLLKDLKAIQPSLEYKVKLYNEEEGVYGNAKMSLVDDLTVTEIVEDLDKVAIMHRFRYPWNLDDSMYMIVINKKCLKTRTENFLETVEEPVEIFY